jgi:hypothetical protein
VSHQFCRDLVFAVQAFDRFIQQQQLIGRHLGGPLHVRQGDTPCRGPSFLPSSTTCMLDQNTSHGLAP